MTQTLSTHMNKRKKKCSLPHTTIVFNYLLHFNNIYTVFPCEMGCKKEKSAPIVISLFRKVNLCFKVTEIYSSQTNLHLIMISLFVCM
jgi:hypothetical protein